jgi:ubiquinone/menaquinone biosynthesis C-methylase UbiE
MLRNEVTINTKKGLHYVVTDEGKRVAQKPWIGDLFASTYDFFMEKTVFPKKFNADLEKHYQILQNVLNKSHEEKVLELAAGNGSAVYFLPTDNDYTGIDISPGLLKKARKNFFEAGFSDPEFYITGVEHLPFKDSIFSLILCMLALNFFDDLPSVFAEIKRVSAEGASFLCATPVLERKQSNSKITGTVYSEKEIARTCKETGFTYRPVPVENSGLLYFWADLQ